VIHRDIKPANILIDQQGVVLVSDFGIAKTSQEATITKSGVVIGTPQYMSPEQCIGKRLTPASDQYSLGIVGFEMLSGNVPFDADSAVVLLQKHITEPPPPLAPLRPDAPAELVKLIERTMLKPVEDRFPTMNEFAEAVELIRITEQHAPQGRAELKALAVGDTIAGLRVVTPLSGPSKVKTKRKPPLVWGSVVGAAVAVAAAIGIWQLASPNSDEPQPAAEMSLAEEQETADDTTAATDDSASVADSVARADSIAAAEAAEQPEPEPETAPPPAVTRPRPAILVLDGIPAEAIVLVDQERQQGSRVSLSQGEHHVAIQARGFQPFEQTLMLRAGQTRTFTPQLVPLPQDFGRLRVGSMPAGILTIDNVEIGELPVRDVPIAAGERDIRIEAPGCSPFDTTITVQANTEVNLRLIRLDCGGRR
jgi:hypothetical protein